MLTEAIVLKYSQMGTFSELQHAPGRTQGWRWKSFSGISSRGCVTTSFCSVWGCKTVMMMDKGPVRNHQTLNKGKILWLLNVWNVLHSWEFEKSLKQLFFDVDASSHLKICCHRSQSIFFLKFRFIKWLTGINYTIFFQTSCCDWCFGMEYPDSH